MKGKMAAQSANRRAVVAATSAAGLREELADARSRHKAEVLGLKVELARLRREINVEAARLVAKERERLENKRRELGLTTDFVFGMMVAKDSFVRQAARYISMTKGLMPDDALAMVLTWMTVRPVRHLDDRKDWLLENGLPIDGWVGRTIRRQRFWRRAAQHMGQLDGFMTLDAAIEAGHPDIHPGYRDSWYPPVEYRGLELVGDLPDDGEEV